MNATITDVRRGYFARWYK